MRVLKSSSVVVSREPNCQLTFPASLPGRRRITTTSTSCRPFSTPCNCILCRKCQLRGGRRCRTTAHDDHRQRPFFFSSLFFFFEVGGRDSYNSTFLIRWDLGNSTKNAVDEATTSSTSSSAADETDHDGDDKMTKRGGRSSHQQHACHHRLFIMLRLSSCAAAAPGPSTRG